MKFPSIPEELLNALREQFPDRCPEVGINIDEVRARAGEQRVIQFLIRVFGEQNENVLQPQED